MPEPDGDSRRVLVVEDDVSLRGTVAKGLREHGWAVSTAGDGASALAWFTDEDASDFDAVVMDIGLPDSDGRDVCQALRARGVQVPVLFLTARDQVGDLLSGFAAGGDEYVSKPFHFGELVARLEALVRRSTTAPSPTSHPELHLDPRTHALVATTGATPLTPTEFRILAALMAVPGVVVRRRELVRAAWPDGAIVHDNTLDQYVARLRKKLTDTGTARVIATAYGIGYRYS